MCKYCEFDESQTPNFDGLMEQWTFNDVMSIKSDYMTVNLKIYRNKDLRDKRHKKNQIELELVGHDIYGDDATLEDLWKNIKYCPFCGEKL